MDSESAGIQITRAHLWGRQEQQLGKMFREPTSVANENFKKIIQSPEFNLSTYGNAAIGKMRFMHAALSQAGPWSKRVKHWRNYRAFVKCLAVIVDDLRDQRAREMAIQRDWSLLSQHERDGLALKAAFAQLWFAGRCYLFSNTYQSEAYFTQCVEILKRMRIVDMKAIAAAPAE